MPERLPRTTGARGRKPDGKVPSDRLLDLLLELDVERNITLARAREIYGGRMSDATWKRVKKRLEARGCRLRWDAKRKQFFVTDPLWAMEPRGSNTDIRGRLALLRAEAATLGPPYGEQLAKVFERWESQLGGSDGAAPPAHRPHPRADSGFYERLNVIEIALRDRRMLRFAYTNTAGGRSKERQIEPYALHDHVGRFYVWGRERVRQAPKFFAVDLMRDMSLEDRFDPDLSLNIDDALRHSFGVFVRANAKPQRILVEFAADRAAYVRARQWPAESTIQDLPDGRLRIEFLVTDPHEVVAWVLGFGGSARVLAPPVAADLARRAGEDIAEQHAWAKRAPKGDDMLEFDWGKET
jgi:predicted DNA-binding transcriptional regulator YafY